MHPAFPSHTLNAKYLKTKFLLLTVGLESEKCIKWKQQTDKKGEETMQAAKGNNWNYILSLEIMQEARLVPIFFTIWKS